MSISVPRVYASASQLGLAGGTLMVARDLIETISPFPVCLIITRERRHFRPTGHVVLYFGATYPSIVYTSKF